MEQLILRSRQDRMNPDTAQWFGLMVTEWEKKKISAPSEFSSAKLLSLRF